jgi:hypothetical protein
VPAPLSLSLSGADLVVVAAEVLLDQLKLPGGHGRGHGHGAAVVTPRGRPRLLLGAGAGAFWPAGLGARVGRRVDVEGGQVLWEHEHALRRAALVTARALRRHRGLRCGRGTHVRCETEVGRLTAACVCVCVWFEKEQGGVAALYRAGEVH